MKTKTLTILFVLMSGWAFGQDYLVGIFIPKAKGGCGDQQYTKLQLKDSKDYNEQAEILRKKYEGQGKLETYFVSEKEFAIVTESQGQYNKGGCTFRKYKFYKSSKSWEDVRQKVQQGYEGFKGLYASTPAEHETFGSKENSSEKEVIEKQFGEIHAKLHSYLKDGKPTLFAQFKNNNKTQSIAVKVITYDEAGNKLTEKTIVLSPGGSANQPYGAADRYVIEVSEPFAPEKENEKGFIERLRNWSKDEFYHPDNGKSKSGIGARG